METRFSTSPPSDPIDLSPRPDRRPMLLVSVRNEFEFEAIRETAIDVIDLKEPNEGPLAPCLPEVWQRVASEWQNRDSPPLARLSAALGEQDQALAAAHLLPEDFHFAKAGPSGCDSSDRIQYLWDQTRSSLGNRTELVAVAYADYRQAGCLPPESILDLAARFGCSKLLVDTYTKDGLSTIDHLGADRIHELRTSCRSLGIWLALAGSVRLSDVRFLQRCNSLPDCVGVRGDVCDGTREGTVSTSRVRAWVEELNAIGKR